VALVRDHCVGGSNVHIVKICSGDSRGRHVLQDSPQRELVAAVDDRVAHKSLGIPRKNDGGDSTTSDRVERERRRAVAVDVIKGEARDTPRQMWPV
jgi:hypothetical protein